MPMLMDTGGNAGSQSSTLIIRALALDELAPRDTGVALGKELLTSLICGLGLGAVNFPVSYTHLDVYKRQVIDSLIAGNVVVLTLDEIDPKLTQRAIDTLSGAVFALSATIRKASDRKMCIRDRTLPASSP